MKRCTVHPDSEKKNTYTVVCWLCSEYLNDGKPVSLAAAAELADAHDARHVESEQKSRWQNAERLQAAIRYLAEPQE